LELTVNFLKTFVITGIALASAAIAFPQDYSSHASFSLPYAARWNSVLLQPGEYKLSIPAATSLPQVVKLVKDGQVICLLPAVESASTPSDASELKLKKVGKVAWVTDLDLAAASKSFHFAAPKVVKEELASSHERPTTNTVALISAVK
jgi:hypothetical protein